MEAALTAEPKSKKKSKAEVSAEPAAPVASAFALESSYGAPAGMPAFLALGIQRKLSVGAVDDPLEREADRVAEQVMRSVDGSSGPLGSPTISGWAAGPTEFATNDAVMSARPEQRRNPGPANAAIQRKCSCQGSSGGHCEDCQKREEETGAALAIQRNSGSNATGDHAAASEAPPIVHEALRSPGTPLDHSVRPFMESRFGRDFSDVRVHTDPLAAQSAQAVNALAYTAGKNLVFAGGTYSPHSSDGRRLLAHELTHVAQQSAGTLGSIQLQPAGANVASPGPSVPAGTPVPDAMPARAPVYWGLDMSVRPPAAYVSVAIPGFSPGEIATYLYGSPDAASSLTATNGALPEHVPAGRILRMGTGTLTEKASKDFNDGVQQGTVLRSQGTGGERPGSEALVYRFSGGGQSFELTEGQYLGMMRGASTWITRKAQSLEDTASVYLDTQRDHVENSSSIIRGISDWVGGADLPDESAYQTPIDHAKQIIAALDISQITVESKGQIGRQLSELQMLAQEVDSAKRAWNTYIEATIEGAGSTAHALEITRDVSFGIAAGLAGAVAAPAIFAAAGGGLLGGTLAVGGGAVAGSVTSGTLNLAGAVGGQGVSMALTPGQQTFDWGYVGTQTWTGVKSGAVQGGLGAAGALAAPGISNVISTRLFGVGTQSLTSTGASLTVNVLTGVALGAPSGAVGSTIENYSAWRSGKITFDEYLASIGTGAGSGALMGGAFSLLPVAGLYRSGGTPVTPRWMFAGPFSPLQADWSPPPGFNALPPDQLPPLNPGYRWVRLNAAWEPLAMNGPFRDPVTLRWYGPDTGPGNYNALSGEQLLGSSAMTRPPGAGGYQGGRQYPMLPQDFIEQGGTRQYIRGHNVDYHDTTAAPGVLDSNTDPANYTPEPDWWGLRPRNNLVQQIRRAGGGYRQMNYYGTNPRLTANSTPIPDGVYFVETDANGTAVRAWDIPFATQGPQTLAGIMQFQIPLNQLPPILLGPPPAISAPPLGGVAAEAARKQE